MSTRTDPFTEALVLQLYSVDGLSFGKISRRLGIGTTTVQRILIRHNAPIRERIKAIQGGWNKPFVTSKITLGGTSSVKQGRPSRVPNNSRPHPENMSV